MTPQTHTPSPVRQPATGTPATAAPHPPADTHHGLMDAFHLPPSQAERRALRMAAERLVGPGGA